MFGINFAYLAWQEVELSAQHSVELSVSKFRLNQQGVTRGYFWLFWGCATSLDHPIYTNVLLS